jgi:hypothetical protein
MVAETTVLAFMWKVLVYLFFFRSFFYRAGLCSGNAVDLHSGRTKLDSQTVTC